MPQIIPIRDLKNTSEISAMCHSSNEPVFITNISSNPLMYALCDNDRLKSKNTEKQL